MSGNDDDGAPNNDDGVDPVEEVREYVKREMSSNDASHDWSHIERVCNNASAIGHAENVEGTTLFLAELACLLHDIKDWKYSGTDIEKGRFGAPLAVEQCLQKINFAESVIDCICFVVANVGFSKQLEKREGKEGEKSEQQIPKEWITVLHIVQDADQLDALGAIGIARCLTFGAAKGRALYDPAIQAREDISTLTAKEYREGKTTTMNHFPEKLFHLKRLMKTETGKEMAEERDAFMREFYRRFYEEVHGDKGDAYVFCKK